MQGGSMKSSGARTGWRTSPTRVVMALVVAFAVLASACGDDKSASDDNGGTTTSLATATTAATTTTLTPQAGGSLTIGLFAATNGFDPANSTVAGSTNGMEMA